MTVTTHIPEQTLVRPAAAAAALGFSVKSIEKLRACGAIDLSYPTLGRLLEMPEVTSATTHDGLPVPVLRLGEPKVEGPDTDEPGRRTGYHIDMTDQELEAASLRWWSRQSGGTTPIKSGLMMIAVGPIFVAAAEIDADGHRLSEEGKYAYSGRIIIRRDRFNEPRVLVDNSPHLELARELLGTRNPLRGGPAILALPTHEETE